MAETLDLKALQRVEKQLHDIENSEIASAKAVLNVKLSAAREELNTRKKIINELAKMGMAATKAEQEARLKAVKENLKKEYDEKLKQEEKLHKEAGGSDEDWSKKKKRIQQEYAEKEKQELKLLEKKTKQEDKARQKLEKAEAARKFREERQAGGKAVAGAFASGLSVEERKAEWAKATRDEEGRFKLGAVFSAISDLAKQLEQKVDSIGKNKSAIDTRLQGSNNKRKFGLQGLSYWDQMSMDITGIAGVSPFITQENVVTNLQSLVSKGISYNVEQRAFLQTISEKIATTFNVADGTLLRLIRVQQQDSTAARLGMESALNAFLNNMYETTEYLSDLASNVRSSLEEAQALMNMAQATELEYQVQKWMGSLYSVGMSSSGVSAIADALGKALAGDISGISAGGAGNLVIMSANQAGVSVADMLADGLDASETNSLLRSMVEYLGELYQNSKDSKVVQQQLAKVYGLTASDLKAVANLATGNTLKNISGNNQSYGGMIGRLYNMADTMWQRTSMGEMMGNIWSNFQYTMANGIASNPALYFLTKAATLLEDTVGGIDLPDIKYVGTGVNLQTSVSELMRVAAMSGGILSGMGAMIANLGAGGGFSGSGMLKSLGINTGLTNFVTRGNGSGGLSRSGLSMSSSGMIGQSDDAAIKEKTLGDANDEANKKLIEAQESENNDIERKVVNESVLQIVDLLTRIVEGSDSLHVKMDNDMSWTNYLGAGLGGLPL